MCDCGPDRRHVSDYVRRLGQAGPPVAFWSTVTAGPDTALLAAELNMPDSHAHDEELHHTWPRWAAYATGAAVAALAMAVAHRPHAQGPASESGERVTHMNRPHSFLLPCCWRSLRPPCRRAPTTTMATWHPPPSTMCPGAIWMAACSCPRPNGSWLCAPPSQRRKQPADRRAHGPGPDGGQRRRASSHTRSGRVEAAGAALRSLVCPIRSSFDGGPLIRRGDRRARLGTAAVPGRSTKH